MKSLLRTATTALLAVCGIAAAEPASDVQTAVGIVTGQPPAQSASTPVPQQVPFVDPSLQSVAPAPDPISEEAVQQAVSQAVGSVPDQLPADVSGPVSSPAQGLDSQLPNQPVSAPGAGQAVGQRPDQSLDPLPVSPSNQAARPAPGQLPVQSSANRAGVGPSAQPPGQMPVPPLVEPPAQPLIRAQEAAPRTADRAAALPDAALPLPAQALAERLANPPGQSGRASAPNRTANRAPDRAASNQAVGQFRQPFASSAPAPDRAARQSPVQASARRASGGRSSAQAREALAAPPQTMERAAAAGTSPAQPVLASTYRATRQPGQPSAPGQQASAQTPDSTSDLSDNERAGLPDLRRINRPAARVSAKVEINTPRVPSFHSVSPGGTEITEYRDRGVPVEIDVHSGFGTHYTMSIPADTSPMTPGDARLSMRLPSINLFHY